MLLKEFIKEYVARNTMIRLWAPCANDAGHKMLCYDPEKHDGCCMEWELLLDYVPQSEYARASVLYVTDIHCDRNREAVNIVVDVRE